MSAVSTGQAGFPPVGIDIKTDALLAARRVLKKHGLRSYVVAADPRALPFADGVFGHVFSYSVLRHTHRRRRLACLQDIWRVLPPGGSCSLEFPIGLSKWRHAPRPSEEDDYESWCVRYYTWKELRATFARIFGNVSIASDCRGGIGVRSDDIGILPWKYRPSWPRANCSAAWPACCRRFAGSATRYS
jgi:SAM-dependent methyltransferase